MRVVLSVIAGLILAGPVLAAEGDPESGQKAFATRCGFCHSLDPAAKKQGPHLANMLGRKAGADESFTRYTDALKNSNLTFDAATLDAYIANPRKTVPGTSMVLTVPDEKIRADIIAYLSANGQ